MIRVKPLLCGRSVRSEFVLKSLGIRVFSDTLGSKTTARPSSSKRPSRKSLPSARKRRRRRKQETAPQEHAVLSIDSPKKSLDNELKSLASSSPSDRSIIKKLRDEIVTRLEKIQSLKDEQLPLGKRDFLAYFKGLSLSVFSLKEANRIVDGMRKSQIHRDVIQSKIPLPPVFKKSLMRVISPWDDVYIPFFKETYLKSLLPQVFSTERIIDVSFDPTQGLYFGIPLLLLKGDTCLKMYFDLMAKLPSEKRTISVVHTRHQQELLAAAFAAHNVPVTVKLETTFTFFLDDLPYFRKLHVPQEETQEAPQKVVETPTKDPSQINDYYTKSFIDFELKYVPRMQKSLSVFLKLKREVPTLHFETLCAFAMSIDDTKVQHEVMREIFSHPYGDDLTKLSFLKERNFLNLGEKLFKALVGNKMLLKIMKGSTINLSNCSDLDTAFFVHLLVKGDLMFQRKFMELFERGEHIITFDVEASKIRNRLKTTIISTLVFHGYREIQKRDHSRPFLLDFNLNDLPSYPPKSKTAESFYLKFHQISNSMSPHSATRLEYLSVQFMADPSVNTDARCIVACMEAFFRVTGRIPSYLLIAANNIEGRTKETVMGRYEKMEKELVAERKANEFELPSKLGKIFATSGALDFSGIHPDTIKHFVRIFVRGESIVKHYYEQMEKEIEEFPGLLFERKLYLRGGTSLGPINADHIIVMSFQDNSIPVISEQHDDGECFFIWLHSVPYFRKHLSIALGKGSFLGHGFQRIEAELLGIMARTSSMIKQTQLMLQSQESLQFQKAMESVIFHIQTQIDEACLLYKRNELIPDVDVSIWTDGSVSNGSAGIGFHLHDHVNSSTLHEAAFKVKSSLNTGEVEAIAMECAMDYMLQSYSEPFRNKDDGILRVALCTDFLSNVLVLQKGRGAIRDERYLRILQKIARFISIYEPVVFHVVWIPSHQRIELNEMADTLAKRGISAPDRILEEY